MPRLVRPPIPIEVKFRVVLRQLGEMWPDEIIRLHKEARSSMGRAVAERLARLAPLLGCEVKDLRLDHDPALGAREKVFRKGVHVDYKPAGSDPEYLAYRPHGPQFAKSHLIKTNVRGDHGQYPDRVLIKRRRRLERGKPKKKFSRPLRSANRWPPKGSQKIRSKKR